ncbi:MAG: hypothetical protein EOO04_30875 [Chitinophagaceae bacterium]|nr:MAG: hypothetical protein EOO04_30875 [Chitinophagaceae bacterium]
MKKFISACLLLCVSAAAFSQNKEVLALPEATAHFFKDVPADKLAGILRTELTAYFSEVELNDKMKEQWGVRSKEELQSLTFPVIIPVLGYYSKDGGAVMGNADQYYIPLLLGSEVKIIASISRMPDGYHVTNIGWPLMAKQLNPSMPVFSLSSNLAYVEIPEMGVGVLVVCSSQEFDQAKLNVIQAVYPGKEVAETKTQPTSFNDFLKLASLQK